MDSSDIVKARVLEFLEKYGDRGVVILKTALELAFDNNTSSRKLGDFSYQQLVMRLRAMGINYNPANLLRILEREYGIIEKTYDSSNQKWYSFVDIESTRQALDEYLGNTIEQEDPRVQYIRIKYKVLEPLKTLRTLRTLASRKLLSKSDKRFFREFVFTDLSKIVSVMEEMMEYQEVFTRELRVLNEILMLSARIAENIEGGLPTVKKLSDSIEEEKIMEKKAMSIHRSEPEF